jgi:ribosomal protein S6
MSKKQGNSVPIDTGGPPTLDQTYLTNNTMSKKQVTANINDEKKVIKSKEFLVHKFSDQELKEMSEDMARQHQEQINLENEKKAVTAQFAAKIEKGKTDIESLAQKINNKQEHRYIECQITMNSPEIGKKTCMRTDTTEIVWTKNMTPEEMQVKLEFDATDALALHSEAEDNHK